jgi:hypothetical protein
MVNPFHHLLRAETFLAQIEKKRFKLDPGHPQ